MCIRLDNPYLIINNNPTFFFPDTIQNIRDMSTEDGCLKIYFCGSICGGRQDQVLYEKIINHLKTYGKVLTEDIGNPQLTEQGNCVL